MPSCPKVKYKKAKKVKKPTLAKMRKILDRLWFEVIYLRDKGTCQKCARKDTLSAHHIFGKKAYPAGRWLLDNGILLCYADHIHYAHKKPYDFEDWFKRRPGFTYTEGENFWINTFLKVRKISQFRSCDFEQIKERLEKERLENEKSAIMVSDKALSKGVSS